jgi:hypothetical protein
MSVLGDGATRRQPLERLEQTLGQRRVAERRRWLCSRRPLRSSPRSLKASVRSASSNRSWSWLDPSSSSHVARSDAALASGSARAT